MVMREVSFAGPKADDRRSHDGTGRTAETVVALAPHVELPGTDFAQQCGAFAVRQGDRYVIYTEPGAGQDATGGEAK